MMGTLVLVGVGGGKKGGTGGTGGVVGQGGGTTLRF